MKYYSIIYGGEYVGNFVFLQCSNVILMATINYLLKGKGNPRTIYLRFRHGKKIDLTKSTNYTIDPTKWSNTKKAVKTLNDAELKKLDKNLRELKNHLIDIYSNTETHHITSEWLENQIKLFKGEISTNSQYSDYVIDHIQQIIDTAHTRPNSKGGLGLSTSRIKSYGNLLHMFKNYCGKKSVRIKEIDTTFANKFLNWMLTDKGYSKNYATKIISDLKTTCTDAGYYGIETNTQLKNIKSPNVKNENIIYLSPSELEQIEQTELKREALKNARRWLILGCHIGQRGEDLLNLNESNLKVRNNKEVLELRQSKGSKDVVIPLPAKAKNILSKGFPKKIHINTFNKHLKDICKLAELNTPTIGRKSIGKREQRKLGTYPKHELISSHVCRRSYATNYYSILPTPLLMQVTGHSTEKMLLKYIGKTSIDYVQQIADFYQKIEDQAQSKPILRVVKTVNN